MRCADYIVEFLISHGIDQCFLLSGGGSIYLDDALACNKNMSFIGVRNEATAPMMAEAYARLKGVPAVVFVTTGPGGTNAVTGVAEAWVDSAPIIVISGQVERDNSSRLCLARGLRSYGTQELDIIEIVKPITKYAALVSEKKDLRYHLEKALHCARSGRPGPVWLDIPLDIQSDQIDPNELRGFAEGNVTWVASALDVHEVLERMCAAQKPLLIIGQGVRQSGAVEILKTLISKCKIPVIASRLGQDILSYSCPYYCGHGGTQGSPATQQIMHEADFILSLGSSLSPAFIGKGKAFASSAYICAVDIEEAELSKNAEFLSKQILCDVKTFLQELVNNVDGALRQNFENWSTICRKIVQRKSFVYNTAESYPINLYYFIHMLDQLAHDKCVFVSDAGSSYYSTGQCLGFDHAKREITSGTFASMGLAIPLAIGAACASTDATILAITGDGSIETNIQELRTLAVEKLNVKLFVINNGGYLSIRNTQDSKFEGRYINSTQNKDDCILDFAEVAKCFGVPYFCIKRCEEIPGTYQDVMEFSGPALIEVLSDPDQKIYNCY